MSTIKLFNKAFEGKEIDFAIINKVAVKKGFLVHSDCCTQEVMDFLLSRPTDYNSTFYKSWNDIISKSRFEIWVDQINSYITNYIIGVQYVPNEGSDQPAFTNLKVILPITKEEANERCCDMLYSGIALSADTLSMVLELVTKIDVEKVKNREAMMALHKKFNTVPTNNTEFVRYLIFLATGKPLLIKDKATIQALKVAKIDLKSLVNSFGIEKLSEVFLRNKPLFLAMKKGNEATVNKLRSLADKYHKTMKVGFFETILSDVSLIPQLSEKLKDCSNFKKVLLLQTIMVRQKELDMRFFGIRNGKLWAKEEKMVAKNHYSILYSTIYQSLVDTLSSKATSVKLPKGVKLTLPTSEKSFIGNYPLGTSFDLTGTDTIVGIHRLAKDAAGYLDFSLTTSTNEKIGWDDNFKNEECTILFSGDICDPRRSKEVAELFYCKEGFKGAYILKVNNYERDETVPFKFFIAQEVISNLKKNYMVNPNNIKFTIDLAMESKEQSIGVINSDKLILATFRTGNKTIAGDSITNKYVDYALNTLDCYLDLEKVLTDAGFTINCGNETLDFTTLSKDSLIKLLG